MSLIHKSRGIEFECQMFTHFHCTVRSDMPIWNLGKCKMSVQLIQYSNPSSIAGGSLLGLLSQDPFHLSSPLFMTTSGRQVVFKGRAKPPPPQNIWLTAVWLTFLGFGVLLGVCYFRLLRVFLLLLGRLFAIQETRSFSVSEEAQKCE